MVPETVPPDVLPPPSQKPHYFVVATMAPKPGYPGDKPGYVPGDMPGDMYTPGIPSKAHAPQVNAGPERLP
jgi:hypothetical protein